jgi:uncharacterized NAD(P)/FAD-binding protein YdhS
MWSLQPRRGSSLPPPTRHVDHGAESLTDSHLSTAAASAVEVAWLPHVVAQCAKQQLDW